LPDELEDILQRYRPVGPAPELRHRVLATRSAANDWAWLAATAALALVTALIRVSAANPVLDVASGIDEPHAAIVQALVESLGSEEHAHLLAETIALQEQVRTAHAAPPEMQNR